MFDSLCRFFTESFSEDYAIWLLGKPVKLTELSPQELSLEPIRADALILVQSDDLEKLRNIEHPHTRPQGHSSISPSKQRSWPAFSVVSGSSGNKRRSPGVGSLSVRGKSGKVSKLFHKI